MSDAKLYEGIHQYYCHIGIKIKVKHKPISVNSCFHMYLEQINNEIFKECQNWIEQKITYFLSVGLSLSSIVPVKEKFTYMKNDIYEK
jgi:hypothetical protein